MGDAVPQTPWGISAKKKLMTEHAGALASRWLIRPRWEPARAEP